MPETDCGFSDVPGGAKGWEILVSQGPTLMVNIGFDSQWKPADPPTIPTAGISDVRALVDTGAMVSCIDELLAVQLNLTKIDEKRPIAGVGGQHLANMYLAQVYVPSLTFTQYGEFVGVHLTEGGQIHQALIGRTFLRHIRMIYEGNTGKVTLDTK